MRSRPRQAVPTSHWQEAKPWIEEWTAVQRHWTKLLLGHKATCPGAQAQMCVSLGLRIFSVSKMSPPPDRQTDRELYQVAFQSQAVLEWSLCWGSLWGLRPPKKSFV